MVITYEMRQHKFFGQAPGEWTPFVGEFLDTDTFKQFELRQNSALREIRNAKESYVAAPGGEVQHG